MKIGIFSFIFYIRMVSFLYPGEPAFEEIQFIDPQHGWLLSNTGEVFIAKNHGTVWEKISTIDAISLRMGFITTRVGFIIGYHSVFKTKDGGMNWISILDEFRFVCSEAWFENLALTPDYIWLVYNTHCIITPFTLTGVIFVDDVDTDSLVLNDKSLIQDGGLYAMASIAPDRNWVVGSLFAYVDTLATGHHGVIYFNDIDEGNNWEIQYVDTLLDRNLNSIAFANSPQGWVCGNKGIILHTRDEGVHWEEQHSGSEIDLNDIHFQNGRVGWIVGKEGLILNTVNGGKTWSQQISGTMEDLLAVTAISVDTAWAVGTNRTLLHTFDGGETWGPSIITNVKAHQIPTDTRLHQNYPNPFNPATTIEYELAESGRVRLTIYNLRGQRVQVLVDEKQPAGTYRVTWNGRSVGGRVQVASGVYVYELRVGEEAVQRKKMVLLR